MVVEEACKYIEIGGTKVKLVEKTCQGSCGRVFWGLPTANNICQACSAQKKPKNTSNPKSSKEDLKPIKEDLKPIKKEPVVEQSDQSLITIDLGDGIIIDGLRKSDADLIRIFLDNKRPLAMDDLFELYYGISPAKQKKYTLDDLKIKKVSLITKISRTRRVLERKVEGITWFGQKKGYWQLKGNPTIEKVATLTAIDVARKQIPRARPSVEHVDKAVSALSDNLVRQADKLTDKTNTDNSELKWQQCVERAKHIKNMVKNNRLILANIAIEACDIVWGGGGHWNNFSKQRTVNDFASLIGLNTKTLYEWIRVKKFVVDKLPTGDYSATRLWKILRYVQEKVTKDASPDQVLAIYNKEMSREGPNVKIKQVIKTTKNVKHFVTQNDLSKIHAEDLVELKATCQDIVLALE